MIHEVDVNLLEFSVITAFIHQANCFHTMGSGIAKQIREKYPEMYEADKKSGPRGDNRRMGSYSYAVCHDGKIGYNLYSQYNFGGGIRHTSYDAIVSGLDKIKVNAVTQGVEKIGLPYKMGCALGGGSWRIVRAIIDDAFENSALDLYICRYEP